MLTHAPRVTGDVTRAIGASDWLAGLSGHLQVVLQFGQGFFGERFDLRYVRGLRLLLKLLDGFLCGFHLVSGVCLIEGGVVLHLRDQRFGLVHHLFAWRDR